MSIEKYNDIKCKDYWNILFLRMINLFWETSVKYSKFGNKYHCAVNLSIKKKDILRIHQLLEKFLTLSSNYYEKLGQINESEQYYHEDGCEIFPYLTKEEFYESIATNVNQFYLNVTDLKCFSTFWGIYSKLFRDKSYKKMYLTKPAEATKAEIREEFEIWYLNNLEKLISNYLS